MQLGNNAFALRRASVFGASALILILAACGGEARPVAGDVEAEAAPAEASPSPVPSAEAQSTPSPAHETATPEEVAEAPSDAEAVSEPEGEAHAAAPAPPAEAEPGPAWPEESPVFERPEHVRGIYLNAWASGSRRKVRNLLKMIEGTEINTFVLDIKDATGYVSHRSSVPMVAEIGADQERRIGDLHGLLWRLKEAGVYPIARIVIVKDPRISDAYPDWAVQDTAGGPWVDGKGQVWLNPYNERVWEYHVELAREVAEAGFPEIQWDYVRFPDAPRSEIERTVYPGQDGRTRSQAIRDLLAYTRRELEPLGVQVTADVFGVTTSANRDVGIGQVWEDFIDRVDVALPMVYPSHYWKGSFGLDTPNAYPYEVVHEALVRAQSRTAAVEGAGTVRPWLQDFTLGPPRYEAPHVRAQIQATYDAGIQEWILWNPGSRYTAEAFAPADGWAAGQEPLIPVADTLVAESRALAYLTDLREAEAARLAQEEAEAAAAQEAAEALEAGSAGGGGGENVTVEPDTTGVRRR